MPFRGATALLEGANWRGTRDEGREKNEEGTILPAQGSLHVAVDEGRILVRGRERAGRGRIVDALPRRDGSAVFLGDRASHKRSTVRDAVPGRSGDRGNARVPGTLGTGSVPYPHPGFCRGHDHSD